MNGTRASRPSKTATLMTAGLKKNLVLLACTITACVLCLELAVRLVGSYDMDNNFTFLQLELRPFHLPLQRIRQEVEVYNTSSLTRVMYDARLGWTPRPGITSRDGLYAYNSMGARTDTGVPVEYSAMHPAGSLRIVLVGDSFTHGEEVPFTSTFGYFLEKKLNEAGIPAEVINLGVGAYGVDQAFLRWRSLGSSLSPDIVILGLQMEDVQRNVNLLRPIYQPKTGLPFSKPQFILSGDSLRLINTPTIPPEQVPAILENPGNWNLAPHEHFLGSKRYRKDMYLRSKFLALVRELTAPRESDGFCYDLNNEPAILARRIFHGFKREVEQRGSRFLIVLIPNVYDLVTIKLGWTPVWADLSAKIEEDNTLIRTQDKLLKQIGWTSLPSLFMPGGHYSAKGNELVAEAIAERLISAK